LLLIFQTKNLR